MYLSPLSPVLKKVLLSSTSEHINYLHTADSSTLKLFFAEKVMHTLLSKRKLLVVIPDGMPSSIPAKVLSPYNLAHFTMLYDKKEPLSALQVERLQRLLKLNELPQRAGVLKTSQQKQKTLQDQIIEILNKISKESTSGPSLKELVLNNVADPMIRLSKEVEGHISQLGIDQNKLDNIDKLQTSYQPYFDFISAASFLSPQALADNHSVKYAIEEVTTLQKALGEVLMGLDKELESAYQVLQSSIEDEYKVWQSIKSELELAIFNNDLSDDSLSFETCYQEVLAPSKKLFYLRLNLERKPELNWGEAQLLLQGIDGLLGQHQVYLAHHYRSLLKRMTPFNVTKPEFKDTIDKGLSIIRAINKSRYLNLQVNTTYLQIGELQEQLNKVAAKLGLCFSALSDEHYTAFKILANDLKLSDQVLDFFSNHTDVSWRGIINFRARRFQIDTLYNSKFSKLPAFITELNNLHTQAVPINLKEVHNIWSRARDKAITDIKNSHWDVYKAIWADGITDLSTFDLLSTNSNAFTSFSPITIVHESELMQLLTLDVEVADEILYLDAREISLNALEQVNSHIDKITIVSSYDIDMSIMPTSKIKIQSYYSSDLKISKHKINGIEPGSDRYHMILPIAAALCDIMNSVTIYRTRGEVIMSFADGQINQLIESELKLKTQNIIYRDSVEITSLVEVLMLDEKITIIIENGLLNDQKGNAVLWQADLLDKVAQVGINIRDISFSDLFKNKKDAISSLCQVFKSTSQIVPSSYQSEMIVASNA